MAVDRVIRATVALREELRGLSFPAPADFVYSPLDYAWASHEAYLRRFASLGPKQVLFLGMNPGPFGMAQTGIPFGEVAAVRDWMGLEHPVAAPERQHPAKKVTGFACTRSEVSGRRLWGLFRQRFGAPEDFFKNHWVHNYNPLLFLENTKIGRNVVPEELPAEAIAPVNAACDRFLRELVAALEIKTVVGVGGYAETRAREALDGLPIKFAKVLHPSPASPVANRGWAEAATKELIAQRVWK
jgi:single-strand selective monofunctional uracil DNA glycosylase